MLKRIINSYRELFFFLKKPEDKQASNQTIGEKFLNLFLVLIIDLLIALISIFLLTTLERQGLFSTESHKLIEFLKSMSRGAVIIVVIIIVLGEEIIFRLYLRYKNNYILRFFIFLFSIASKKGKEHIEKRIKKIWYERYAFLFFFSAILFGFVHIFNFDSYKDMIWLFPIITAPQILFGLFAGYLRVRFSLMWGFLLHVIHNLVLLLPLLIDGDSMEALNIDTTEYTLKIEEVFESNKEQIVYNFPDSVCFQNYELKNIIAYTMGMDNWLIEGNNNDKMNKNLNLWYKSKVDSNFIDKRNIEKELIRQYNFSIDKERRKASAWSLRIVDSLKLNRYKTSSDKGNYMKISNDSVILQGVQLYGIAYAIKNSKKKEVFLKDKVSGRFNIKLNTTGTLDLMNQLDSIYGLELVDSVATIEYVKMNFDRQE